MAEDKGKTPGEEQEANDERTLIRGQDSPVQEGNDDATVVRASDVPASQEPNDDATLLRSPEQAANKEAKRLGFDDAGNKPEANDDETVIRSDEVKPAPDESVGSEETVVRKDRPSRSGSESHRAEQDSESAATILRGPSEDSASATILRAPASESATILRKPGDGPSTNQRGHDDHDDHDDDATVIGLGQEPADDDDRTIINDNFDDDSTVIGASGDGQDTTYIASVGKQQRPQGNTEAGRLLKNRFVLEEKVGSGGMGDVYKALDLRQQEAQERDPYIAIKLLNENFAKHKDAFLSLQRETSRTRGIPHPNIMGVYDFDREGDTVFMSMELLDGKPLDDFLKEHPEGVSVEDAWNIIDGISKGLMRAHDAGIVHSDFKPGNIFYTRDKTAKVFDFGIARAISNPNEIEADGEKTVFDAGSLGALTPTYASYEMLKGLEPTKSDDVYALALVAYELFMGKHPYDRVPADKAFDRGLKPKPVPFLKRRHWKALRKALELKGENRTQSVDEFFEGVFSVDPPYFRYAAVASMLLASVGFGVYQTLNIKEKPEGLIELENAVAGAKVTLNTIGDPQWESSVWHDQVATALQRWKLAEQQMLENEEWVEDWDIVHDEDIEVRAANILSTYMDEIARLRGDAQGYEAAKREEYGVTQALDHLNTAKSYMDRVVTHYKSADPNRVEQELKRLEVRLQIRGEQLAGIEEQERLAEEQRLAVEAAAQAAEEQRMFEENRLNQYNTYLADFREILKCKGRMPDENLDQLGQLLTSMRSTWQEAYDHHYSTFVDYLATCIQQRIGYIDPEHARIVQTRVASYLPGEDRIASLVIEDKDPCDDRKLVGRGDRNQRWCSDRLSEGGDGPQLVVIPPMTVKSHKYAISRAEITVNEYNFYCRSVGCGVLNNEEGRLPATNLTIDQARAYANWLSGQSGQKYRLPSVQEWDWAVGAQGDAEVDENVNCTVDSRGVRLGEKLQGAISGKPNPWGLYNYVGNAREWAVSERDEIIALGGAHTDPRNECTLDKRVVHQGQADPVTGFRLLREIEDKDAEESTSELASSS